MYHATSPIARRLAVVLCCCLLLALAAPAAAQNQSQPQTQKKVNLDFDQVDLKVFIKFVSNLTDKNFVVDDKVKGKVTILSPTPLSVDEVYKVFQSVLEVNGFTTIPSGNVVKIVRTVESRQKDIPLEQGSAAGVHQGDAVITQIIPLDHADAGQLRKILVPMISKEGLIVAYPPTEMLIVIDYASNVRRINRIIQRVDKQPFDGSISLYSLEHASAADVSKKLSTLLGAGGKGKEALQKGRISLVADERTNAIIFWADPQNTQKIRTILAKLDQPTPQNLSNIQVVPLENAQAEELAKVLSQLAGSVTKKEQKAGLSQDISIVADKPSNSLVVIAEPKEISTLMPIIKQLDAPRKQVFVEAAIIEVSSDSSLNLGINWQGGIEIGSGDGAVFGGSNGVGATSSGDNTVLQNLAGSVTDDPDAGLSLGTLAFPFTFNGQEYFGFGNFLNAAQTDNAVNIISTPQLMTMENEEAKVVIAENRPFVTSQEESDANNDYTNYEYKDVGVTLKVTPLINNKGKVQLNLYQEVSRVDETQTNKLSGTTPVTRKRTTETTVAVQDGQTVVISGLMENKSTDTLSQVPFLGDLPVLGALFRNQGTGNSKTNLMVFITPKVVNSGHDAQRIAYAKSRELNHFRFGDAQRYEAAPSGYKSYGLMQ